MARTADDYEGAIRALLPRGRVWRAEPGSGQQSLVLALAQAWARLDAAATLLLDQSLPGSNLDLVPEWEESLALPDPCAGPNATIEQRAAQVLSRFMAGGGQNEAFFIAFAAAIGFEITISYISPFRVSVSTVETPLYDDDWLTAWIITVHSNTGGLSNDVLLCELNALKPAQTTIFIQ
ncbi:putative phage tail protein [Novosphingobium sp. 9]|uniref:putative phage tail protein n=1 Tax=Novosphingobium sp. 9 TaxID=2025349 RepID=UPI0021B62A3A|nr:putative phage tail protein [Novosphingobium sp. 9]